MLPFLAKAKEASASAPVETITREHDEGVEYDAMEAAGQDLIDAVHAKDPKAVAEALRAAYELNQSGDSDV